MKKWMIMFLVLGLFMGLLAVAGCGGEAEETSSGEVTVGEEGESVTMETEEGTVTYEGGEDEPSEEDLGVPIYPGAEYVSGSGGSATATTEEGATLYAGGEWITDNGIDEVVDWYTDKLGDPDYTTSEGGQKSVIWMKGDTSDNITTVTITEEDGEVKITIGRISG